MQTEIRKLVHYRIGLELSQRELELLRGMLQNPLGPGEQKEISDIREKLWLTCNEALKP